ncbi:MAG: YciI family protein [Pseudomonadota bacterium]
MYFAIYCVDKPDHGQVRADNRQAHLDYLNSFRDQVHCAGPLTTDDGSAMLGSLLIMEFADKAKAQSFAENDPYSKAGLFQFVDIHHWKKVI